MTPNLIRIFSVISVASIAIVSFGNGETGDIEGRAQHLSGRATSDLVGLTRDPDWRTRSAALIVLSRRGGEPGVPEAAAVALADDNSRVRAHATHVLSSCVRAGDTLADDTVEALRSRIDDPDAGVRSGAVEALGAVGADAGVAVLAIEFALEDPDDRVRQRAVWALGAIGAPAGVALGSLRERLGDHSPVVRVQVPAAIARIEAACEDEGEARTGSDP